jgi:hypothetical protein
LAPFVSVNVQAEMWQRLEKALQSNAKRSCVRPLLPGQADAQQNASGRADAHIIKLLEPTGGAAECLKLVVTHRKRLGKLLFAGQPPPRFPPRLGGYPRKGVGRFALFSRIEKACAALPEMVQRAVVQQDACSPYLPGRRRWPKDASAGPLGTAIALLARLQARSDPQKAIRLLVAGFRLSQDLDRGQTPWAVCRAARALAVPLVLECERILNRYHLDAGILRWLQKAIRQLQKHEPTPRSHLVGAHVRSTLHRCALPLKENGDGRWKPPSAVSIARKPALPGVLVDFELDRKNAAAAARALADARWLSWLLHEKINRHLQAVCRPELGPADCRTALDAAVRSIDEHLEPLWNKMVSRMEKSPALAKLAETLLQKHRTRAGARSGAQSVSGSGAGSRAGSGVDSLEPLPSNASDSLKVERRGFWRLLKTEASAYRAADFRIAAQRSFYWAALALHVAIRRTAVRGRRRLSLQESTRAAFSHLDPYSGKPLRVKRIGPVLLVLPPLSLAASAAESPAYRIRVNLEL